MTDQAPAEQAVDRRDPVVARVQDRFGDQILDASVEHDQPAFVVSGETLLNLAAFLRDEPDLQFVRLVDLCAIDYLTADQFVRARLGARARFEVVYHFHSFALQRWVRVRVPVAAEADEVPSLTPLWPGANWFEREVYDLFGLRFANHPDLTRILMPDEWEGNPLRKDYQPPREPHEWSFNPEQWQKAVQRGSE